MNKEASIEELEHYIVSNWEQHWDYDHIYFICLLNGDILSYCLESQMFYTNDLNTPISSLEAFELIHKYYINN